MTKATGRSPSAKPPTKAASKQLLGKAPLGNLPRDNDQSAASSKTEYSVGDVVFWGTPTTAGNTPSSAIRLVAAIRSAAESIACGISETIRVGWRGTPNYMGLFSP